MGIMDASCNERTGKFSHRNVEFADRSHWWKPEPRHVQERIGELGLVGGKLPSTSGMKDVVKNLTDAEDKPKKVELKEFQKLTSHKMFFRSMDNSTVQFEMATLITDMCNPTVRAVTRLMRVMSCCNLKPKVSLDVQAGQAPKVVCGWRQCVR